MSLFFQILFRRFLILYLPCFSPLRERSAKALLIDITVFTQRSTAMPRLVGRQSNVGAYILSSLVLIVAAGGLLQYAGLIDIPGLVQDIDNSLEDNSTSQSRSGTFLAYQDLIAQEQNNV